MFNDSDPYNPYIVGNPVDDPEVFFGREDIFQSIRRRLIGKHRDNVIMLCGQSRTGKTSVLRQMRSHLDTRYLCIFIDLQAIDLKDLGSFLWGIANSIVECLQQDYNIILSLPDRTIFMVEPDRFFANEFLRQVWSMVGDRHVLLMLDEATRLQEKGLEQRVLEYMRPLMQHSRLSFLFSFSNILEEVKREHAFLFNIGLYIKISFLDQQSTYDLISKPVKDYYCINAAALERVFRVTSGHPYYTQLLCHCLFNRWQDRRTMFLRSKDNEIMQGLSEINVQDVDAVLDEAVELGELVLTYMWDESSAGEKAILAGMAAVMNDDNHSATVVTINKYWSEFGGIAIPEDERIKATKRIIARDIINYQDNYIFTVELMYIWIKRQKRVEWVAEEIKATIRRWKNPEDTEELVPVAIGDSPPPLARPQRKHRLPRLLVAVIGTVVIASALVLIFSSYQLQSVPPSCTPQPPQSKSPTTMLPSGSSSLKPLYMSQNGNQGVAWSPDGRFIASSDEYHVYILDSSTGRGLYTCQGSEVPDVWRVAWSPDSKYIASGGDDGTMSIWSAADGKGLFRESQSDPVRGLAWSPDSSLIASGDGQAVTRIWNVSDPHHVSESTPINSDKNEGLVYGLAWSHRGKYLAIPYYQGQIEIWDIMSHKRVATYPKHNKTAYFVAWSKDDKYIASVGTDGKLQVWNAWTGENISPFNTAKDLNTSVFCVAWSPDGKYIAVTTKDSHSVYVYNAQNGDLVASGSGRDWMYSVSWAPDSKRLVTGSLDHTVQVWQLP